MYIWTGHRTKLTTHIIFLLSFSSSYFSYISGFWMTTVLQWFPSEESMSKHPVSMRTMTSYHMFHIFNETGRYVKGFFPFVFRNWIIMWSFISGELQEVWIYMDSQQMVFTAEQKCHSRNIQPFFIGGCWSDMKGGEGKLHCFFFPGAGGMESPESQFFILTRGSVQQQVLNSSSA